ncbi:MAG TPA: ribosome-associated translation inhibitor RaiA [Candidatus Limnocylindrales bacterium]|jgi:putative sigma-54 modulation protein
MIVKGKNVDVPESVREYADRKMRRLERFQDERSEAVVELSNEQHRSSTDSHIVELTLVVDGQTLRGHATGPTYQAGLDAVLDRIERQAVDLREKPRGKVRPDAARARQIVGGVEDAVTEPVTSNDEVSASSIVKTKRFAIEPMFEEDAVERMEELGHLFFIFVNAETEKLCVLYKRKSGDYGLIEPMIGGQYTPGRNSRKVG